MAQSSPRYTNLLHALQELKRTASSTVRPEDLFRTAFLQANENALEWQPALDQHGSDVAGQSPSIPVMMVKAHCHFCRENTQTPM